MESSNFYSSTIWSPFGPHFLHMDTMGYTSSAFLCQYKYNHIMVSDFSIFLKNNNKSYFSNFMKNYCCNSILSFISHVDKNIYLGIPLLPLFHFGYIVDTTFLLALLLKIMTIIMKGKSLKYLNKLLLP